jgi:hypothetical protein
LGRVTGLRGQGRAERYDRFGNLAAADWTTPGGHPATGAREYAGTELSRAGNVRYRHDVRGRLIWRELPGGDTGWTFGWNSDDRLEQVLTPGGRRWRYSYDA